MIAHICIFNTLFTANIQHCVVIEVVKMRFFAM